MFLGIVLSRSVLKIIIVQRGSDDRLPDDYRVFPEGVGEIQECEEG